MSKAKRVLRSVRFKYIGSIKRISKCSHCILLAIFLFITAVIITLQERGSIEEFSSSKLDEFQAADYVKRNYQSTVKLSSTRKQDFVGKGTQNASVLSKKVAKAAKNQTQGLDPRFTMILVGKPNPAIKVFYKGKLSRSNVKANKEKPKTTKKLTYRDVFYAMAHPRLFPTTTEKFERNSPTVTGLNDWVQANSPRDSQKLLIYSAYWDDRFDSNNFVRVMTVMVTKNPPTVYCRLQMADEKLNDVIVSRKIMNEHWRLKYASYFLSCEVAKNIAPPSKVFISLSRNFTHSAMLPVYQNKENTASSRGDIAVCVKPFHYHYDRATWLVEFIEFHRILGVEHFFFYNHTVGEKVDALLRSYMKRKIVTVLPWNLPVRSQKEIRTEGIFSSLNDCVYRTMYLFHYVILLDFDEYIVPREHDNYLDLLEKMEEDNKRIRGKPGSFVFRNTFFYLYWENDTAMYGAEPEKPPQWMPYFVTQYKTRRLSTSMKTGSRSKYIVVPDRVVEVGNHVVWRHTSGSRAIQVPDNVALLHHYRICEFGGFSCLKKPNLVDRTANKFGEELLRRAVQECSKIYPELDGKCPLSPPLGSPW